jgi:hypothetical protein
MITPHDDEHFLRIIRSRLADYSIDIKAERQKLLALWQAHHPEAAAQPPSGAHRPLMLLAERPASMDLPEEEWTSDIYSVVLRRRPDRVFGTRQGMIQLGISALDGTARHDWREFQWIKNQLAGPECEAFELYPAESRLLDPSNYYSLWCFPGLKRIKVGSDDPRRVWNAGEALAPQRGFDYEP